MNQHDICRVLSSYFSALFICEKMGDYYRIRTPFLYPDGDNIDLYCKHEEDQIVVSDLGETVRWLRMQTVSLRRSPRQTALIEDACLTHGVEFFRGMLQARCSKDDTLMEVINRTSQAALRISDLWFTFRTRAFESAIDEVADFLSSKELPYERGKRLVGRSSRLWTIDFHVRAVRRSSLVYVLSSGSKSAARSIVNAVHTAFFDLNHLTVGQEPLHFISLFDDMADVWSEEDFRLAEQVSTVTRWSRPDEFVEVLQAA